MEASSSPAKSDPNAQLKRTISGKRKQTSFCQVTGCGQEVIENQARRLRTCEMHRRALTVNMDGIPSRFCQQCTLIHPLDQFDGNKRGCRRRLELRNSRRQQKSALHHGKATDPETPGSATAVSTPFKERQECEVSSDTPTSRRTGTVSVLNPRNCDLELQSSTKRAAYSRFCDNMSPGGRPTHHGRSTDASSGTFERPSSAWQGYPGSSGAMGKPVSKFAASWTPEDWEKALASMQWSQTMDRVGFGRRGSISDGMAAMSPAERMMYFRLPSFSEIPFVDEAFQAGSDGSMQTSDSFTRMAQMAMQQEHAWPETGSRYGPSTLDEMARTSFGDLARACLNDCGPAFFNMGYAGSDHWGWEAAGFPPLSPGPRGIAGKRQTGDSSPSNKPYQMG